MGVAPQQDQLQRQTFHGAATPVTVNIEASAKRALTKAAPRLPYS